MVELEDEADVAGAPAGQLRFVIAAISFVADPHFALAGPIESGDQVEQRRLARSAGPHQRQEFSFRHFQVESVEHVDLFAAAAQSVAVQSDTNNRLRHKCSSNGRYSPFNSFDNDTHVRPKIFTLLILGDFIFTRTGITPGCGRPSAYSRNDSHVAVGVNPAKRLKVLVRLGHDSASLTDDDIGDVAFLNLEIHFEICQIGHFAKTDGDAAGAPEIAADFTKLPRSALFLRIVPVTEGG